MEKENLEAHYKYRSRSPIMKDYGFGQQTRQSQYMSRHGFEEASTRQQTRTIVREVREVRYISQHHELFVSDLQSEIADLKNKQRDYGALKEQYSYLSQQYKEVQIEKQRLEDECLARIGQDRVEVDRLIRELDGLKVEDHQVEEEQIRLLETITVHERDVMTCSSQLCTLRQQVSIADQSNLSLREEIGYTDSLLIEQKEISHQNYKDLTQVREVSIDLDKDLDN